MRDKSINWRALSERIYILWQLQFNSFALYTYSYDNVLCCSDFVFCCIEWKESRGASVNGYVYTHTHAYRAHYSGNPLNHLRCLHHAQSCSWPAHTHFTHMRNEITRTYFMLPRIHIQQLLGWRTFVLTLLIFFFTLSFCALFNAIFRCHTLVKYKSSQLKWVHNLYWLILAWLSKVEFWLWVPGIADPSNPCFSVSGVSRASYAKLGQITYRSLFKKFSFGSASTASTTPRNIQLLKIIFQFCNRFYHV